MVKQWLTYLIIAFPLQLMAQDYSINRVEIEGGFEVYCPTFYHNKIVVCSNKKDEVFKTIIDESNAYPVNLYLLNSFNNTYILNPLSNEFKTRLNDGPISFNKFYNRCIVSQNFNGKDLINNHLSLVEYEKKDDEWIKVNSFVHQNPAYSYTHPALSSDGNTLIFSSNMPGGHGGFDLWKSVKIKGVWSKPINLGSNINSSKNEFFPTFVNDELYFSSNQGEIGGLDIYKAHLEENRPPTILPKPLNSEFDDFSIIGSILDEGYLSSNRGGKDELLKFSFNFPEFENCDYIVENNFCYTLYEESAVAIPNQEALIYHWTINGEKRQGAEVRYCFPGPGDYEIILDVEDTISHIMYPEQSHLNITLDNVIKPYINSPDTVDVNSLFYLDASQSYLPYMENKKYFWLIENKKMFGEHSSYQFKQAGTYNIKLGVIGYEDTIKINDCVYKTIVCVDDNLITNLNKDFETWKNEIGNSFVIAKPEEKGVEIGESFTLEKLNHSSKKEISDSEKEELDYLVKFLISHPTVNLSIKYFVDLNNDSDIIKDKVLNILNFLISSGIDNDRINLVEKNAKKNDKTNHIEFKFNVYEND